MRSPEEARVASDLLVAEQVIDHVYDVEDKQRTYRNGSELSGLIMDPP